MEKLDFLNYFFQRFKLDLKNIYPIAGSSVDELITDFIFIVFDYFEKYCRQDTISYVFESVEKSINKQQTLLVIDDSLDRLTSVVFKAKKGGYKFSLNLPYTLFELFQKDYIYFIGCLAYHIFLAYKIHEHIDRYSETLRDGELQSVKGMIETKARKFEFEVIDFLYSENPKHIKCGHHQELYDEFSTLA